MVFVIKLMAVYFLFIAIFGSKDSKSYSVIMSISCILLILFPLPPSTSAISFIEKRELYIMYDGGTALIISMMFKLSKDEWKHALLLAFASLCHIMVILSIKNNHAGFFYFHYHDLIITVGILQMMVSYDGLINALSNLQKLLLRTYHYCDRSYQSFFTRKSSEKRT